MSTTFTIIARNSLQQQQSYGGDIFRVLLKHEESGKLSKGSVNCQNNGTYIVILKPTETGLHSINVFLNGIPFIKPETIHVDNSKFSNLFLSNKTSANATELDLSNFGLETHQVEHLSLFKKLSILNLSNNKLEKFPIEILTLSNLKSLNLNYNKLVSLPSDLGGLTHLTHFTFSHNPITTHFQVILEMKSVLKLKTYLLGNTNNKFDWKYLQAVFR